MCSTSSRPWRSFERELTLERTHAGLAQARALGRRGGRTPAMGPAEIKRAKAMLADPTITVEEVAAQLGADDALPAYTGRAQLAQPGGVVETAPIGAVGRARAGPRSISASSSDRAAFGVAPDAGNDRSRGRVCPAQEDAGLPAETFVREGKGSTAPSSPLFAPRQFRVSVRRWGKGSQCLSDSNPLSEAGSLVARRIEFGDRTASSARRSTRDTEAAAAFENKLKQ